MDALDDDILPLEQRLALAHAFDPFKSRLRSFLHLDHRLGQFVSRASEPMVTQLRLAWWREQLKKPPPERPAGDPVLDSLSALWIEDSEALGALVDAWEGLLAEPPLPDDAALELCTARGACFASLADHANATHFGEAWSLADLAARTNDQDERAHLVSLSMQLDSGDGKLPFRHRSLTILGSLGRRSLDRNGGQLLENRRDFLHVARVGLLGR